MRCIESWHYGDPNRYRDVLDSDLALQALVDQLKDVVLFVVDPLEPPLHHSVSDLLLENSDLLSIDKVLKIELFCGWISKDDLSHAEDLLQTRMLLRYFELKGVALVHIQPSHLSEVFITCFERQLFHQITVLLIRVCHSESITVVIALSNVVHMEQLQLSRRIRNAESPELLVL